MDGSMTKTTQTNVPSSRVLLRGEQRSEVCARRVAENRCPIDLSVAKDMLVLGESGRTATYHHLRGLGIARERIPLEPEEFSRGLTTIFGPGAQVLKRTINRGVRAIRDSSTQEDFCSRCAAFWLGEQRDGGAGRVEDVHGGEGTGRPNWEMMKTSRFEGSSGQSDAFLETMGVLATKIGNKPLGTGAPQRSRSWQVLSAKSVPGEPRESGANPVMPQTSQLSPAQKADVFKCVEEAFDIMGRTGKEVFFELLRLRHNLTKDEIVESPGRFMSILKIFFDTSAQVLERNILWVMERDLGVSAPTFEEAVASLKRVDESSAAFLTPRGLPEVETVAVDDTGVGRWTSHLERRGYRAEEDSDKFVYHYSSIARGRMMEIV